MTKKDAINYYNLIKGTYSNSHEKYDKFFDYFVVSGG